MKAILGRVAFEAYDPRGKWAPLSTAEKCRWQAAANAVVLANVCQVPAVQVAVERVETPPPAERKPLKLPRATRPRSKYAEALDAPGRKKR